MDRNMIIECADLIEEYDLNLDVIKKQLNEYADLLVDKRGRTEFNLTYKDNFIFRLIGDIVNDNQIILNNVTKAIAWIRKDNSELLKMIREVM